MHRNPIGSSRRAVEVGMKTNVTLKDLSLSPSSPSRFPSQRLENFGPSLGTGQAENWVFLVSLCMPL